MSIDAQNFEAVAAADRPKLIGLCLVILRNQEDAEDAVQAGFALAWQHLDQYRGQASLSTWIYQAVKNAALDQLRKRKIRHAKDHIEATSEISSRDPPVDVAVLREERIRQVCSALGSRLLNPLYRDLLADELTGHRIPNTRLHRVRRRRAIAALRSIVSNRAQKTTQPLRAALLEVGNNLSASVLNRPVKGRKAGVARA